MANRQFLGMSSEKEFDAVSFPVVEIDLDMKVLYRNESADRLEAALSDSFRGLLTAEAAEYCQKQMQQNRSFFLRTAAGNPFHLLPGEKKYWAIGESFEDEKAFDELSVKELAEKLMDKSDVAVRSTYHDEVTNLHSIANYFRRKAMAEGNYGDVREADSLIKSSYQVLRNSDNLSEYLRCLSGEQGKKVCLEFWKPLGVLLDTIQPKLPPRKHFHYVIPDSIRTVRCDFARVVRGLFCLIDNALFYAEDADVLLVGRETDNELTLSLEDNGPGFPPEVMERLYEPFNCYRGENLDPHRLGLGMYLAQHIAQEAGGKVEVENRKRGSLVMMTLPLTDYDPPDETHLRVLEQMRYDSTFSPLLVELSNLFQSSKL